MSGKEIDFALLSLCLDKAAGQLTFQSRMEIRIRYRPPPLFLHPTSRFKQGTMRSIAGLSTIRDDIKVACNRERESRNLQPIPEQAPFREGDRRGRRDWRCPFAMTLSNWIT